MINGVTTKLNIDRYLLSALAEDITSEDVTTNAVMPDPRRGTADLICKQSGILCGLAVFERVFQLLDDKRVSNGFPGWRRGEEGSWIGR